MPSLYPSNDRVQNAYQSTAPTNPRVGDIWVDTSTPLDLVNTNQYPRRLNVNGDAKINQRVAGSVSEGWVADNFYFGNYTNGTVTAARDTADTPNDFQYAVKVTVTGADTSITSGQIVYLEQGIEGYHTAHLKWGTASASPVTLSFWTKGTAGTYSVFISNYATNRMYLKTFTVTGTWTKQTITIPGCTDGTWRTTTLAGLRLLFMLTTSDPGTQGSWLTTTAYSVTGQSNLMAANGNTFAVAGIQVEQGTIATPFEQRLFQDELIACMRYYQKSWPYGTAPGTAVSEGALMLTTTDTGTMSRYFWQGSAFPVEMSDIPTVTVYGLNGTANRISVYNNSASTLTVSSVVAPSTKTLSMYIQTSTGGTAGIVYAGHYTAMALL